MNCSEGETGDMQEVKNDETMGNTELRGKTITIGGISLYWRWVVVLGAFLILSLQYGARYSFGVFVKPMYVEYGWERSVISLGASINIFMYALGGIQSGWLLDRMAPKWIMTCGTVVTACGFFLAAGATSPLTLYLSYGLMCGLGGAGIGLVVCSSSVVKWFDRHQGMATGIATMGIGFGTMALAPLAGYITKHHDWRSGFITLGIIILVVGISISQSIMRKIPPEGYAPELHGGNENGTAVAVTGQDRENNNGSLGSLFKDYRYWVITLFFTVEAVVFMMTFVHQVAFAIDSGIEKIAAASSLGAIGIAGLCGRFFFGWFSDRIRSTRIAAMLGILIMALGIYILLQSNNARMLYLYALIFGFGYGSFAPLMPVLVSEQFGRRILGSAYGSMNFFVMGLGGGLGPIIGGVAFDRFGSYRFAWYFDIIILIGASLLMIALKPRSPKGVK